MYVKKLSLKNYRNIQLLEIELKKGINIFYGKNAQGKTNLLEAIYIGATGRSHRTHIDKELINFDKLDAHIKIEVIYNNYLNKIDIHLKKDSKKGIALNNLPLKKLGELFGALNVVIFSPEDLNLIKRGPLERRKFIDIELCQVNKVYYDSLFQYHKILKHRNALLKKIFKQNDLKETLFAWDIQLIEYGKKIIKTREDFIKKISKIANKIHNSITKNQEFLQIKYKPNVSFKDFESKLNKSIEKDILYQTTSVGPHKDDILFFINDINVKDFGSQGQQRTVSLSTKLAEIDLIKKEKGIFPVLLLDDVFSELDQFRQKYLISNIKDIQVIITCTGIEDVIKNLNTDCKIFEIEDGKILEK